MGSYKAHTRLELKPSGPAIIYHLSMGREADERLEAVNSETAKVSEMDWGEPYPRPTTKVAGISSKYHHHHHQRTTLRVPMNLNRPKISRALSVFSHTTNSWTPIPFWRSSHDPVSQTPSLSLSSSPHPAKPPVASKHSLTLTTWNIQASYPKAAIRCQLTLDHILQGPKEVPDIIHLQEVAPSARHFLLNDTRIRATFLTTDAEDDTAFRGVPFATMTLLSKKRFGSHKSEEGHDTRIPIDSVFRTSFPSRYKRDALCVDVLASPGKVLRLLNVHLDSFDSRIRRVFQMMVLDGLLRENGYAGGVVAGNFNAIDPEDHGLVEKHGLVDAWVKLRGVEGGETWGVDRVGFELEEKRKPKRLDKVVMLGAQPIEIEVLEPGRFGAQSRWSDHCGLRCVFTI
ncbi:Endonuclease/exonuclease/phosphatase [Panaeolus papilionaceus]|nr:Endonuclease/exonuclease/phosphatase [Panaeolus papilionaceus]